MASRPSLVTSSGRFDVAQQQVSLSEDAKVEIDQWDSKMDTQGGKVNNGAVHNSRLLTSPGPAHTTNTLLPTSTEGLSITPALQFTKDQNTSV